MLARVTDPRQRGEQGVITNHTRRGVEVLLLKFL